MYPIGDQGGQTITFVSGIHGVEPVRAMRLVQQTQSAATLELIDAWVDQKTGGLSLIRRVALTLPRVSRDAEIYAGVGDDWVLAIVATPEPWEYFAGDDWGNTSCDHYPITFALEPDETTSPPRRVRRPSDKAIFELTAVRSAKDQSLRVRVKRE